MDFGTTIAVISLISIYIDECSFHNMLKDANRKFTSCCFSRYCSVFPFSVFLHAYHFGSENVICVAGCKSTSANSERTIKEVKNKRKMTKKKLCEPVKLVHLCR